MSKSTPLFELNQNNNNIDIQQTDTRPIVADILKEIEMQNNNNNNDDYVNEQQKALDYQTDNLVTGNDISSNIHVTENNHSNNTEIDNDIMETQRENQHIDEINEIEGSQYSVQPNNNREDMDTNIDEVLTQKLPSIEEIPTDTSNSSFLSRNKISYFYKEFRDPLLIFLIAMVITVPKVQVIINNILQTIPFLRTTTGHMICKSFIIAALYYYLNKYI